MFGKDDPILLPDDAKFVSSLTDEQALYLWANLKDVRGKKVMALRETLMHRCLDLPDKTAARQGMLAQFYKTPRPIVAVPVDGLRPRRK